MVAQNEQRKDHPLTMPVLGLSGEDSWGELVGETFKSLANDVQTAVIPGAGHWFAEHAPQETLAALTGFLAPYKDAAQQEAAALH
jgi:pimeloyl-ACP methyl ester carboxylesterase